MDKLIGLNEAAALLGITPEELNDMRSRSEIFGYRDGASWKFKQQELQRVAEERGTTLGGANAPSDDLRLADDDDLRDSTLNVSYEEFFGNQSDDDSEDSSTEPADKELSDDLDDNGDDHSESILVSEEELGGSERNTSSTIIGKTDDEKSSADSDLRLADDDAPRQPAESSDIQLSDSSPEKADSGGMSDLNLADDDDDLQLASGSDATSTSDIGVAESASSDIGLGGGSDVDLDSSDLGLAGSSILGGGSGKAGSDLSLDEDDDEALELATDADDDLELGEDLSAVGSGVALDDDDDDGELVLDGGSDVSLAGDSGINLIPADSGISLDDEPLELSGSGISSLELPEDEDQVISLEEEADPDEATMVKGDNDFMLTPVDEEEEDPSDSGSQVIALDTEELDAEAATQLGMAGGGQALMLDEDESDAGMYQAEPAGAAAGAPATAYAGAAAAPAEPPETPYSIWQVLSLFLVVLLLAVSGMLMMDVIRNIWSFDQPYAANTSLMDMILDAVGKSK